MSHSGCVRGGGSGRGGGGRWVELREEGESWSVLEREDIEDRPSAREV